jgi:hypothetical protein
MDFAIAFLLVAFVTLAAKVAFVLAAAFSILVVLFVARELGLRISYYFKYQR